jgi:hypothetical protein
VEQIEERSRRLNDGTFALEVINSKIYRDSSGRVRIQSEVQDSSGHCSDLYTSLIDPVAGLTVVVLSSPKIAYRMPRPKSDALLGGSVIAEGLPPSNHWVARTENAGKRTIEGFEFKGTRIIQTADGEPGLTHTIEQWYSDELKLTGLEVASGPHGTHRARIQNIHREEPDPTLFAIPRDYKILDVQLPPPDPQ